MVTLLTHGFRPFQRFVGEHIAIPLWVACLSYTHIGLLPNLVSTVDDAGVKLNHVDAC